MRHFNAVNNVNNLLSAKSSTASRARKPSAQVDFNTMLTQRAAGVNFQRTSIAPSPNRLAAPAISTLQPDAALQQLAEHMANVMDPVKHISNKFSAQPETLWKLEATAFAERNGIQQQKGDDWRSLVDNHRAGFREFYSQIAGQGRLTPEITQRYHEALANLDAHEKKVLSGEPLKEDPTQIYKSIGRAPSQRRDF